jgi:hypothetical protein
VCAQGIVPRIDIKTNKQIETALSLTRRIYAQPISTKIIADTFISQISAQQKMLTETQLLAFLYENQNIWPVIEQYLTETSAASAELADKITVIEAKYLKRLKPLLPNELKESALLTIDQAEEALKTEPKAEVLLTQYNDSRKAAEAEVQLKIAPLVTAYKVRFSTYLALPKVQEHFQQYSDPLVPLELAPKAGTYGYEVIGTYVNHPIKVGTKLIQGKDLKEQVIRFIRQTRHEIAMNFFDFDLMDVANELVRARRKGLSVKVGIDASVIAARPEVKAVYDKLLANDIAVYAVNSVGLNHQKLIVSDWKTTGLGKVVLMSGNLTQSCIGPEGDLVGFGRLIPESRPNANHMVILKSDLVSSVVHHEIAKNIDVGLRFRGRHFPVGGTYLFRSKEGTMQLAFSPNGAAKSINKNFIVKAISEMKSGSLKFVQFAFSSKTVEEGLFEWFKTRHETNGSLPLYMVVDKPFGMQGWSIPLAVSGMALEIHDDKTKRYVDLPDSKWKTLLNPVEMKTLQSQIKIAPPEFQQGKVMVDGVERGYTVKIHHKLLIGGPKNARIAIIGSFNFSSGAEQNQEFIARFDSEPEVSEMVDGIADYLYSKSRVSIYDEAMRRNQFNQFDDPVSVDVDRPNKKKSSNDSKLASSSAAIDCNLMLQIR